jgi:hypothetical protein
MQVNAFLDDDDHHLALPERADATEDARADLLALSDEPVQPLLPLTDDDDNNNNNNNNKDAAADAPSSRKLSKAPLRRVMPRVNDSEDDAVPAPPERVPAASERGVAADGEPASLLQERPVSKESVEVPAKAKRKKRVVVDAGGVSDFELISRLLADAGGGGDDGDAETHALVDTQDHADA